MQQSVFHQYCSVSQSIIIKTALSSLPCNFVKLLILRFPFNMALLPLIFLSNPGRILLSALPHGAPINIFALQACSAMIYQTSIVITN
jgi:hypothetical protein